MQPTKQLGWGCVLVICCLLLCLNCGVELSLLVTCHIGQKHEFSYWMKIARKENFSPMIKLTCRYYTWLYCSSVYAAILKKYNSWLSFHKSWQSLWSTINFKGIRIYFQFPLTKIFTAIKSIGIWALHNYMIESFRLFIIHEDHTYRFWSTWPFLCWIQSKKLWYPSAFFYFNYFLYIKIFQWAMILNMWAMQTTRGKRLLEVPQYNFSSFSNSKGYRWYISALLCPLVNEVLAVLLRIAWWITCC